MSGGTFGRCEAKKHGIYFMRVLYVSEVGGGNFSGEIFCMTRYIFDIVGMM